MEASVWDAAQASMAQGSDAAFVQAPVSMRDSSYTDQVLLPASFGTVAVGETFHAVISATNTSTRPLTGVRIRVELHSEGTEKFAPTSFQLADVPGPVALAPGAQVTAVVRHGIEALATHALVCRIRSDQPTAQGLKEHWLAKQYRFAVSPPPFVMSSAVQVSSGLRVTRHPDVRERERTWIRLQLRNTSARPVHIESLHVETTAPWTWAAPPTDTPILLMPQDLHQALLELTPTQPIVPHALRSTEATSADATVPAAWPLGQIRIAWRVPGAEPGRLRIGPIVRRTRLPRPVQGWYAELYVQPTDLPWRVDEPCTLPLRVSLWPIASTETPCTWDLVADDAGKETYYVGEQTHSYTVKSHDTTEPVVWDLTWTIVPCRRGVVKTGGASLYLRDAATSTRHLVQSWPCVWEVSVP
ncbi:TRAPPIII complex protein [Malassezia pachydermatis]